MDEKQKLIAVAGILTAALAGIQDADAHMEPEEGDGMEKCYGVVKEGKNDCASVTNLHSCASMAVMDGDPNEWIKVPQGLCDRLVGGSTKPKDE